jgi:dipeptidyl aminopeptidase/acylaminoacyl peptidase
VTPPVRPSPPPRAGDPYGLGIVGSFLAPVLAIVGLLIVAIITINLLNGELPLGLGRGTGTNGGTTGDGGPARTPAPSNVVVVPEPSTPTDEPLFLGAMTYAKAGNIWIQTDDGPTQLTDSGTASMPSWSPDGKYIYYIETKRSRGFWPVNGRPGTYDMEVPHLMRVPVDRSGPPEDLHSGRFREGNLTWFSWMRQPVVSPSGRTVAMVTDQPRPDERDVVVQLFSLENGKFTRPDLPVTSPLGHQDPAWRPDGRFLAYVRNGRDGATGAPVIYRYDVKEKAARPLTSAGYLEPSYSPDGKYLAATRQSTIGTDIVILDGRTGTELLKVTNDGRSWGPKWSPAGDGIAFLNINGQSADLRLARLGGTPGAWTVDDVVPLTDVSGLDAASKPDWYIPADQLPEPSTSPAP